MYPEVGWRNHLMNLNWAQGEHLMIAAGTGRGKSTMVRDLTAKRSHTVVLVCKVKDPTFEKDFRGWERYETWPKNGPKRWHNKVLLWPKAGKDISETIAIQKEEFLKCVNHVALHGNRCIVFDETLTMATPKFHNIGKEIEFMHTFGRSAGISAVTLMQRPAWVPKTIFSQVSHAYFTGTTDMDDLKRLRDLSGSDSKTLAAQLVDMPTKFDYAYTNPTGDAQGVIVNTRRGR